MTGRTTVAAIFHGPGRPLEIREVALPRPTGREVLVEVVACTLCGSDLHSLHGRRPVPTPTILGHEILGRVAAFGPDAPRLDAAGRPLAVGDRVAWAVVASCGDCFPCRARLPQKCERGTKYGHEAIRPGRELTGGLAGHCLLVEGTSAFRVPEGLPDAVACPAGCATATVAAALEAAGPVGGSCVLVLGSGMLGLTAAAWARAHGAAEVVASDVDPARLALAGRFGATRSAPPGALSDAVREASEGRGADVVLEMTGAPEAVEAALALARVGGTVVLVGSVFPTRAVEIVPERIVRRCLTLRGVHNYRPEHLAAALDFLASRPPHPFESLVDGWRPLSGLADAIAQPAGALRIGVRSDA